MKGVIVRICRRRMRPITENKVSAVAFVTLGNIFSYVYQALKKLDITFLGALWINYQISIKTLDKEWKF